MIFIQSVSQLRAFGVSCDLSQEPCHARETGGSSRQNNFVWTIGRPNVDGRQQSSS